MDEISVKCCHAIPSGPSYRIILENDKTMSIASMKKALLLLLVLLSFSAFAQEELITDLPLSEEAINVFQQTIFLTDFTSTNCENIDENRQVARSLESIRNRQYRIVEYSVAYGSNDTIAHEYYVETYQPPALIQIQVFSRSGNCINFSFSLISQD